MTLLMECDFGRIKRCCQHLFINLLQHVYKLSQVLIKGTYATLKCVCNSNEGLYYIHSEIVRLFVMINHSRLLHTL